MFVANKCIGLHFPTNDIGLSSFKFFWWAPKFLFTSARGRFGRSRSSKVDKFGANRKRICDFLLVRNSNFGPILHRIWARTPPLFNPNFGGVPVAPDRRCWAPKSAWA